MSETEARRLVDLRSGGRCEGCGRPATNFSHRCARSGGGLWLASNGLKLCGSGTTGCHGWIGANPVPAEVVGWRVLSGEHPTDVPVWIRSPFLVGWHRLDDAGVYDPLWDRLDVPDELPAWLPRSAELIPAGKSQR